MLSWAAENIDLPEYDRCVDPCHLVALFHPLLPWTPHFHTHPESMPCFTMKDHHANQSFTFVYLEIRKPYLARYPHTLKLDMVWPSS